MVFLPSEVTVLIPFRSGHQSGRRQPLQLPFNNQVLIPFRSGHQSGRPLRQLPRWKPRLNPFQIRASVRTQVHTWAVEYWVVLIPFRSGHQSGPPHPGARRPLGGLNPFQIRASVRTLREQQQPFEIRLNPFQIRASVRTIWTRTTASWLVLIPFRSGHQSGLLSQIT